MFPVLYLPSSAFSSLTAPVCVHASAAFVMRSSECLSFPNSSLHTDWLPVSPRYRSKHKTAWHGARLSASQRKEHAAVVFRGRPTHGSDLLEVDFSVRWSGRRCLLQRSDSAAGHATAARALLQIRQTPTGNKLPLRNTRPLGPQSRQPRVWPRKRDEVITSDTGRAGARRLLGSETETSTACSPKRPEVTQAMCMSSSVQTEDGEPLTSHWDTETLIMASTSCSTWNLLLSTSPLPFPPVTFWQSLLNLLFSPAWTFFFSYVIWTHTVLFIN